MAKEIEEEKVRQWKEKVTGSRRNERRKVGMKEKERIAWKQERKPERKEKRKERMQPDENEVGRSLIL